MLSLFYELFLPVAFSDLPLLVAFFNLFLFLAQRCAQARPKA
jgi:hypothetical protein